MKVLASPSRSLASPVLESARGVLPYAVQVGERLVLPPHGVVEVVATDVSIPGSTERLWRLRLLARPTDLLVPGAKLAAARPLISARQALRVFSIFRESRGARAPAWHTHLLTDMLARAQSGSIIAAAEVVRDLHATRRAKKPSSTAMRVFDLAHGLVVIELALATGRPPGEVAAKIARLLGK
jgi:RNA polymerase-interacting CarD/CdnL/TRCF family regulator